MNLKSIRIENFFPIGEEFLTFNDVKYAVFGINHDDQGASSNGAGKSALLHAILWCLFGTTPREGLLSDGVIGPNGDHVRVVLTFTHKGRTFEIDRGRKVPGRRNSEPIIKIDGEDVSLHKGNDKLIEQELGFSRQAFMLAGYAAARRPSFCELTPAKKLEVLTEVLDLTPYDAQLETLKTEGLARKSAHSQLMGSATLLEQSIEQQNRRVASIEQSLAVFQSDKTARVMVAEQALQTLTEALRAPADAEPYEQQLADAKRSLSALQQSQRDYQTELPKLQALQKALDKNRADQKTVSAAISELQDRLDNVMLLGGGECAYCGSHLTKINTELMHKFAEEQKQHQIKLALLKASDDHTSQQIADFSLPEKPDEREIERLTNLITAFGDKIRQAERAAHQYQLTKQKIASAERELASAKALSPDDLQRQLERELKIAEDNDIKLDKMASELARLEDEMEALKTAIKIVKKTKQEILFAFIASLEQQIQIYFEKMQTDLSVKAVIDGDKLDLLFHNSSKQGVYYPYGVFSGGEAARIDKAVTLALNGVFGIGLYIDDEALASLDSTGSRALVDFLFEDAESTRLLVFHNKLLEDYFDRKSDTRQILVEKKHGKATLRIG